MREVKNFCLKEGLGLTCSAQHLGDDVRVIVFGKKSGKQEEAKAKYEPKNGSDGDYHGFEK